MVAEVQVGHSSYSDRLVTLGCVGVGLVLACGPPNYGILRIPSRDLSRLCFHFAVRSFFLGWFITRVWNGVGARCKQLDS